MAVFLAFLFFKWSKTKHFLEICKVTIFKRILCFYIDRKFSCKHDLLFLFRLVCYTNLMYKFCILYYIFEISRYTNIFYIRMYLVLTYTERLVSFACHFFSYIWRLVSCMCWVSKFRNFFLTCLENEARFIFEGFLFCHWWKVLF